MLAKASIIGFVPVSDLHAAEKFFSGKLGLPVVTKNDGFALVLQAGCGGTIRCVLAPDAKPRPFTILGWEVPDLESSAADLVKAGVPPILYPHFEQDAAGIWTAPTGDKVLWFNDPDGNVLSLSQHTLSSDPGVARK